jgi:WD40 repeat protein
LRLATINTNLIRVWKAPDWQSEAFPALKYDHTVTAMAYNADGTALVIVVESPRMTGRDLRADTVLGQSILRALAGSDSIIEVRDVRTGQQTASMREEGSVHAIALGSGSQMLITASTSGISRVWPLHGGRPVLSVRHEGPVNAVAVAPGGGVFVTGSDDTTARVWELATGRELARLAHKGPVMAVAFSPDGKYLLTRDEGRAAWLWRWQPADLIAEACARLTRHLTEREVQEFLRVAPPHQTCQNPPVSFR